MPRPVLDEHLATEDLDRYVLAALHQIAIGWRVSEASTQRSRGEEANAWQASAYAADPSATTRRQHTRSHLP